MASDVGRYGSWLDIDRTSGRVKLTIATRDDQVGAGNVKAARVLRVYPSGPNSTYAAGEHIGLLNITVDVRRDNQWPPPDVGQGMTILLNREQVEDLRCVLDEFVKDAVVKLPSEIEADRAREASLSRAQEIAATIRSTGDPFGSH